MKLKDINIEDGSLITTEAYVKRLETLTSFNPLQASNAFYNTVLGLNNSSIQIVLAETNPKDLVIALKGCDKASIIKALKNLSKRVAFMVMEDMDYCGSIPDNDILEAQSRIMNNYRELLNAGRIV